MTRTSKLDAILREAQRPQRTKLDAGLRELQEMHCILLKDGPHVKLWNGNEPVPEYLVQLVRRNERRIARKIDRSDPLTCCNPALHGPPVYLVCRWCCPICSKLRLEVNSERSIAG